MSWKYEQATGNMLDASGKLLATGYSGANFAKNNPSMQNVHNQGPIPRGNYFIDAPVDTVTHGPYVLRLVPTPSTNLFNRAGFLIHGDSVIHPGTASEGCIILPRFARERIWESNDHSLEVVSGEGMVSDPEIGM